jgi:hypothetical protein
MRKMFKAWTHPSLLCVISEQFVQITHKNRKIRNPNCNTRWQKTISRLEELFFKMSSSYKYDKCRLSGNTSLLAFSRHTDKSRQAHFLHQTPQDASSEQLAITAGRWLGFALNFIIHEMIQFAVISVALMHVGSLRYPAMSCGWRLQYLTTNCCHLHALNFAAFHTIFQLLI